MNKNNKLVPCPKCFGTREVFNGFYMKKCNFCKEGSVLKEIEESFIDEQLMYE